MNPLVWYDLSLFVLLFGVGVYVFVTARITSLHKVYFLFHSLMMMWPFCQFAVTLTDNPGLQLFYVLLAFVAVSLLGSGWLLLTLFITGYAERLSNSRLVLLFVPAVIGAIGVVANPWHDFVMPLDGGYIDRAYGPWFWVVMCILVSYFLVSLVIMFRAVFSSKTPVMIKKQVQITLWGIFVLAMFATLDAVLNVLLSRWLPIIPGLTSLGIFLSDLFFVYVIKRYNVFDLVSIAHEDVINTIPYGILVLDENEVIVEVNKASKFFVQRHVGDMWNMEEFLAGVHVEDRVEADLFLNEYRMKKNIFSKIEVIMEQEKAARHFIVQSSPILDAVLIPIGYLLTFQDVSQERFYARTMHRQNETLQERNQALDRIRQELSEANRKLEELVLTDSLTQCYNRRYLTQHLNHEVLTNLQYKTPFSLMLLDIDHFKAINDHYGHVIGDEVLVRTAEAVRGSVRSTDILTRYGGEEFMIYLPHTEHDLAIEIAERVRKAVESNRMAVNHEIGSVSITMSIGILSIEDFTYEDVPEDGEGYLIQLFDAVDKALYQAKQKGRNRVEHGVLERGVM
ncbi:diguanylate cyclase [Paenibacillus barcinonensis]|uniref:Diguanylate cyclase n=1 Tax=Paenibacillus barcinonensis TaxID=198119 RepID=A0A2V4VUY7_PAEBA|nr:diguanylate cyclase [Paenibacillus barcinonensis]PYE48822.1 diguanylate cyclase (GGDEF)-like protein [Paenibacillus barcinonensis]QKS57752.1 diguanylate cyclase [Paenibacillus barcinonensis]